MSISTQTAHHNRSDADAYMRIQLSSVKPDIKMISKMYSDATLFTIYLEKPFLNKNMVFMLICNRFVFLLKEINKYF